MTYTVSIEQTITVTHSLMMQEIPTHSHTWRVRVWIEAPGIGSSTKMSMNMDHLKPIVAKVLDPLDGMNLNTKWKVPTTEVVAGYILESIEPICRVRITDELNREVEAF